MSAVIRAAVDLVLVSTVFAGIRRSSGFNLATDKIDNETARFVADKFLETGEWVMDRSVEGMSRYPNVFSRKN